MGRKTVIKKSTLEFIEKLGQCLERAGINWLEENDPRRMTLSWAEVPDEVFVRGLIRGLAAHGSEDIAKLLDGNSDARSVFLALMKMIGEAE